MLLLFIIRRTDYVGGSGKETFDSLPPPVADVVGREWCYGPAVGILTETKHETVLVVARVFVILFIFSKKKNWTEVFFILHF